MLGGSRAKAATAVGERSGHLKFYVSSTKSRKRPYSSAGQRWGFGRGLSPRLLSSRGLSLCLVLGWHLATSSSLSMTPTPSSRSSSSTAAMPSSSSSVPVSTASPSASRTEAFPRGEGPLSSVENNLRFHPPTLPGDEAGDEESAPTFKELSSKLGLRHYTAEGQEGGSSVCTSEGGDPLPSSSAPLIFLVRHGQTALNKEGRIQGRGLNPMLNAQGRSQGLALGEFLKSVKFDSVTSSSLHRAHETAQLIVSRSLTSSDMHVEQDAGLDELSWGVMEGQLKDCEPGLSLLQGVLEEWKEGNVDKAIEKGESPVEVLARGQEALRRIVARGHRTNLVVSHGRTIRVLLAGLPGRHLVVMKHLGAVPNCGLYVLQWNEEKQIFDLLRPPGDVIDDLE